MLLPFLAYYLIFRYRPIYGLQIAFKDYSLVKGVADSPWVGLDNFITLFQDPYFFRVLRNTIMIGLYTIVFYFPIPIILALLLNELRNKAFKRVTQTFIYIPHFISVVIVAGLVTNFLAPTNGIVNIIISRLGGEKIYFLVKPAYFRPIYILMQSWKEAGFASVLYLAALSGIDIQLYESAIIDGANRFKQTWHITLPGILPTIVITLLIKIGNFLDIGYEAILLIYQPVTYEVADVINTYTYRMGILLGNYEISTVAGFFNSLVGMLLVIGANALSRKFTEHSLW